MTKPTSLFEEIDKYYVVRDRQFLWYFKYQDGLWKIWQAKLSRYFYQPKPKRIKKTISF